MENIKRKGDKIYPTVELDKKKSIFRMEGNSIPQDGKEYFDPILSWFDSYAKYPNRETNIHFTMNHFNISSSKAILFMLYKLMDIQDAGYKVKVTWHYSDAYILQAGRDYAYMVKVPFQFKKKTEKEAVRSSPKMSLF